VERNAVAISPPLVKPAITFVACAHPPPANRAIGPRTKPNHFPQVRCPVVQRGGPLRRHRTKVPLVRVGAVPSVLISHLRWLGVLALIVVAFVADLFLPKHRPERSEGAPPVML
jgi:hypothetical protein